MCAGKTRQTSDNTFILTVDGDTDFEPHSIQKMLNQLRGNKEVGVVCGRIHPIGNGKLIVQCGRIHPIGDGKLIELCTVSYIHLQIRLC